MAEQPAQQQPHALRTAFPAPPPFYAHFTSANVSKLKQSRKDAASPVGTAEPDLHPDGGVDANEERKGHDTQRSSRPKAYPKVLQLPAELRYLVPAEPPQDGRWRAFGRNYNLNEPLAPLSASGISQLYQTSAESNGTLDPTFHLIKIVRSILLNFLELIGILSQDPTLYAEKIDTLQTLFYNAHHAVNEYRPHQARETLIIMMEEQLSKARDEVAGVKTQNAKIEAALRDLRGKVADVTHVGTWPPTTTLQVNQCSSGERESKEGREQQKDTWTALDTLFPD
ncbi:Mediator of RNA polymerase II transcription subunit 7 [Elasticomyces elasticus]|nr:Mediator of RNA polymerase II transcription subunit 7 [Elasticomyces elasticus]